MDEIDKILAAKGKLHLTGRKRSQARMRAKRILREGRDTSVSIGEKIIWREALVAEQKGICTYCGKFFTPDDPATFDHIIRLTDGGEHSKANGRAVHLTCNHLLNRLAQKQ